MPRRWIAPWIALCALVAPSARADVDIPTAARCGDVSTNSVTNKLYAVCEPNLVEVDGATHAQRSLAVAGRLAGVDPIHDRVVTWANSSVTVVDVPSWSATVYGLSPRASGSPVALDPAGDAIWVVEPLAGRVIRLDGTTGATTPVSLGATGSTGFVSLDPMHGLVYAGVGGPSFVEIDMASLATRTIAPGPPLISAAPVGVDPLRQRVWAIGGSSASPSHEFIWSIDPATAVADAVWGYPLSSFPSQKVAIDPGNERVWTHAGFLFDGGSIVLRSSDGTPAFFGDVDGVNAGVTASPATGRAYVGRGWTSNGDARLVAVDATPLGGPFEVVLSSPPLSNYSASPPAVMLSTNKAYVSYGDDVDPSGAKAIREVDEAETDPIPLPVAITHDPVLPDGSVVVHFDATSGFPTPLPIAQIYYQVDSIDGVWTPAPDAGPSASTTLSLAPGPHTVHAFAVDGQEATISELQRRNPVTGPVESIEVTFVPPACANGLDDDGDGLADHPSDPGCYAATSMKEDPKCDDDVDNDGDGGTDWDGGALGLTPDAQCVTTPWKDREVPAGGCGLGAEIALALGLARAARRRRHSSGCSSRDASGSQLAQSVAPGSTPGTARDASR